MARADPAPAAASGDVLVLRPGELLRAQPVPPEGRRLESVLAADESAQFTLTHLQGAVDVVFQGPGASVDLGLGAVHRSTDAERRIRAAYESAIARLALGDAEQQ